MKSIQWLIDNISKVNIAKDLPESKRDEIASRVVRGYNIDLNSRKEWESKANEGLKIARQVTEKKNYPFEGAANVKYPLIAISAINFAARVYPQIIQGSDIVKAQIIGKNTPEKEARAKRVSQHMSYQLLEQMPEWEPDTDQLLTSLPCVGMHFRKTYYDTLYQRNRSVGITALDLVVNQKIKDLKTSRRATEKIYLYKNDVIERERMEMYLPVSEFMNKNDDEDEAELFLEQHCWIDLDDDGYEEPYICIVHEQSAKLARIVARYDEDGIEERNGKIRRIQPVEYYTDYGFLPDPAGGFYKLGFAHLLGPINESISTVINQLLDAGHWANTHNGFIAQGIRIKGGKLTFEPNEWKFIDTPGSVLKDGIVPLPTKEPSMVLFQLLGLLIETGKTLSSVSETMTGEMPGQNTPATTVLAMIEQGLKVFSSIYKRVFRSLKSEYKKLYRLNRLYMDDIEYITILDDQLAIPQSDYDLNDLDVIPTADPTISSEAQRLARARAVMDTAAINPCPSGRIESLRYYLEAIGVPNLDKLLPAEEVQQALQSPPPDPKMVEIQAKVIQMQQESDLALEKNNRDQVEMEARVELIMAQVEEIRTRAIKNVAEAESKEAGIQIDSYTAMANAQRSEREQALKAKAEGGENGRTASGGVPPMEAQRDDAESMGGAVGNEGILPEANPEPTNLDVELAGSDGNANYAGIGEDLRSEFTAGNDSGIEGRAKGGPVTAGKPYMVGEKGPELIIPDQDGVVVPNKSAFDKTMDGIAQGFKMVYETAPEKAGEFLIQMGKDFQKIYKPEVRQGRKVSQQRANDLQNIHPSQRQQMGEILDDLERK